MITNSIDLQSVGIYTAAFALSGMFVNFVTAAMSVDYYPRLTSVVNDKGEINRLVNEQTEIGVLLAMPGLLATLSLSPWIIKLFYTSEFLPAVDLLHWFVLGCFGRVVSWPLGFIMLTLGKNRWFFVTETCFILLHVTLIFVLLNWVGLEGVAIAFALVYVVYAAAAFHVARHLTEFAWTVSSRNILLIFTAVVATLFLIIRVMPIWAGTSVGCFVTIGMSIYCIRELIARVGREHRFVRLGMRVPGVRWILRF
jgi:PST family polysaccharide transporter